MSKISEFLRDVLDLFIKKFPDFISGLFKKIPKKLADQILVFVKVAENIENYVPDGAIDFLTAVIPGDTDDKFAAWLRKVLPGVLKTLEVITVHNDTSVRVNLPDDSDAKNSKLGDIASLLTKKFTGASLGQSRVTTESVFQDYQLNKA